MVACLWLFPGTSRGFAQGERLYHWNGPPVKFDDGNFLVEIEPPPGMIAVELHSPTSVGGETTLMLSDEVKASFADDGTSRRY